MAVLKGENKGTERKKNKREKINRKWVGKIRLERKKERRNVGRP